MPRAPAIALAGVLLGGTGAAALATSPPQRVVSINVCADALLAELLPRERIVSVTFLGADARYSPRAATLAGIARNRGGADEVLAHRPDLVVAGRHARAATTALLQRLGVPVVTLELATSLPQARRQVLDLAAALGVRGRGAAVVAEMDRRLASARAPAGMPRPRAVLLRPGGFTAGPDTLAGAVLSHAGFHNLAGDLGIRAWGFIDLERLLLARAQVIILQRSRHEPPSQAAALLTHPALAKSAAGRRAVSLDEAHMECPGPWVADAALALAALRP